MPIKIFESNTTEELQTRFDQWERDEAKKRGEQLDKYIERNPACLVGEPVPKYFTLTITHLQFAKTQEPGYIPHYTMVFIHN